MEPTTRNETSDMTYRRTAGEWNSPATTTEKSSEDDSCPESASTDVFMNAAGEFHSPAIDRD